MTGPVRVGLVGCGDMGLRHLKAYAAMKARGVELLELAALCDTDEARLESLSQVAARIVGEKPEVYKGVEGMLAHASRLDAVDVVVPPRFHHSVTVPCLDAGKDVMVEKPLGITVKACRAMIEMAERSGRTLAVAENYRRLPPSRALKALLEAGRVGRPYMLVKYGVNAMKDRVFVKVVDRQPSLWRHDKLQMGGWAVEYGCHEADLIRYWLGEVDEVYGIAETFEATRYAQSAEGATCEPVAVNAEDTDFATLRFRSGVVGFWAMSLAGHGESDARQLIYGSKGCVNGLDVTLDDGRRISSEAIVEGFMDRLRGDERERLFPRGTYDEVEFAPDASNPLRYGVAIELYDFADSVIKRRRPEVDGYEGLKDVALGHAILESSYARAPVHVEDVELGKVERYQAEINRHLGL